MFLPISHDDFKIISKFASTGRTFDNAKECLHRLEDLSIMKEENDDRAELAIDELEVLHKVVENFNEEAKKLAFTLNNLDYDINREALRLRVAEQEAETRRLVYLLQLPTPIYKEYKGRLNLIRYVESRSSRCQITLEFEGHIQLETWFLEQGVWSLKFTEKYKR